MNDTQDLFGIGTYSLITRLTKKALHFYEEKALLVPARKEITGYRQYTSAQIPRGLRLKLLSDMGFGINEMQTLLDAMEEPVNTNLIDGILSLRRESILAEVDRLELIEGLLEKEKFLEVLTMDKNKPCIKEVPATRVVSKRETGSYQETIPKLLGELFGLVMAPDSQRAGVKCIGPPMFVCHDKEYKESGADIEIAVPIIGKLTVGEGLEVKTIPAGKVVSTIHKGVYNEVGKAYKEGFNHVAKEGLSVAGPTRELYLNDPGDVVEGEQLTEVQIPIE